MQVSQAMEQRGSCRAYLTTPVPQEVLEKVLALACRAPSAINLQPWQFTVVRGEEVPRLARRLLKARKERGVGCAPDNVQPLPEAFVERRRQLDRGMKPLMIEAGMEPAGFIDRGSLSFYGAPAVVVAALSNAFGDIRALDLGLAIGWLLLAAQEAGLASCPLGLVAAYANEVADQLNIGRDYRVLLAVALGYPDPDSPLNRFQSPRAGLSEVVRWY